MNIAPKISICIPTFNRYDYLKVCLDSVMRQTYKPFEVLVVDNASTDGTSKLLTKYAVRVYRQKKNVGMVENFNSCVQKSNGNYIAFLHSDDILSPLWNEVFSKYIKTIKADIYTCSLSTIDSYGKTGFIYDTFKKNTFIEKDNALEIFPRHYNPMLPPTGATVFSKKIFNSFGYFEKKLGTEYDLPFSLYCMKNCNFYYIPEILFTHRTHSEQTFEYKRHKKTQKERVSKIQNSFRIFKFYAKKYAVYPEKYNVLFNTQICMNICSNNLYIFKGEIERVVGGLRVLNGEFPSFFSNPKNIYYFIKFHFLFILRFLLAPIRKKVYSQRVKWITEYIRTG